MAGAPTCQRAHDVHGRARILEQVYGRRFAARRRTEERLDDLHAQLARPTSPDAVHFVGVGGPRRATRGATQRVSAWKRH